MNAQKKKKRTFDHVYKAALCIFTAFVMLDTFLIPHAYSTVSNTSGSTTAVASTVSSSGSGTTASTATSSSTKASTTSDSYSDGNITIKITTYRENDTNIYVADVTLKSADYLNTVLANGTYGRNITATTSTIAEEANAILAINGDYYGAQQSGYVIRNGVLYRSTSSDDSQEDLVIDSSGNFSIVTEGSTTAQALLDSGAQQVLSFGPALVENSEVVVSANEEVGKAKTSNPRTAIGQIDSLHYVFVVSDGRTSESEGLSLSELATFMQNLGCKTAYNLDGGGSSTMVFNGTVINQPTTNGNTISERKVSDIVSIGY